jgi:hypothetical protein
MSLPLESSQSPLSDDACGLSENELEGADSVETSKDGGFLVGDAGLTLSEDDEGGVRLEVEFSLLCGGGNPAEGSWLRSVTVAKGRLGERSGDAFGLGRR